MKAAFLSRAVLVLSIACLAGPAAAQEQKPLKLLVGFGAGGVTDTVARAAADKVKDILGRPVVVENRPGAGGRLAANELKAAAPDGNTLMVTTETIAVLAAFTFRKLDFDTRKDFIPVAQLATFQLAFIVPASSPAKTFGEYATWLKANPAKANFGALPGSQPHFFGVMIGRTIGVDMTYVPYNSGAQLALDLTGGHVNAGLDAISQNIQAHNTGKVRMLATSGATRSSMSPGVPTFRELGYDLEGTGYLGVFAPAGTPKATIDTLSAAFEKAMAAPDVRARLAEVGLDATGYGSQQFAKIMDDGFRKWGPIIKSIGFVAD